jgi:tripartite-type tricarboxylate transporter receptor subunit TctC
MRIRADRGLRAAAFLAAAFVPAAFAQAPYPTQQIRIICPFPAGGGTDLTSRLLGEHLSRSLGQPVVVENRTGASGMIGTGAAAKSPADGYTLLVASGEVALNPHLYKDKMAYDWDKELQPITLLVKVPNVLAVNMDVPAKNVAELIALAKSRPGFVNYGSSGPGGAPHLAAELFKRMAGVDMTHIPYKASAQSFQDLLGGQVMITMDSQIQALPYIRDNRLRALGVLSARRVPSLPDVPTIAETVPGYELTNWFGLVAPAATPKDLLAKISTDVSKALQDQGLRDKITALSAAVVGDTPEQFGATMRADSEKWARVIREANIKAE